MKTVGFVSLGCAKNLVDTEVMLGLLKEQDMEIVEDCSVAEVIIVNTCTFIEKAKDESIRTILEMGQYKKSGRCKALIVAGCLSQQYQEELFNEIPEIDAILGTGSWNRIIEAIEAVEKGERACFMEAMQNIYDEEMPRMQTTPQYSTYIKIADGCNNGCAFCIIPQIRGPFRSRSIASIVKEVQRLAAQGVKEFNLIAQDTTSYGIDLAGKPLLPELLRKLVKIDGVKWLRLLYLYPNYFTDELLDLIAQEEKICAYVDLPLQHISDSILKRMNRRDSQSEIMTLLRKIRQHDGNVTLRTAFIVGFPGETDAQFKELCDFVEEIQFDNVGVFTYSQEEGTPAAKMTDQIPEEVKEDRYHALMAIQAKVSESRNRLLEGSRHMALIEKVEEGDDGQVLASGRLDIQAPDIDGTVYIENPMRIVRPGDMVLIEVAQGFAYDVVGDIVEE